MRKIKNCCCLLFILIAGSCTFDYGNSGSSGGDMPDLVMENVEYVRVKSAFPLARIEADRVERYEKQNLIKLENLSFEQYGERGREVNVYGKAGYAQIETNSGNILLDKGVVLDVENEDVVLETYQLEWKDEPKLLSTDEIVYIYRENGTRFTGSALRIDARRRTWEFINGITGTYIYDN